MTTLAIMALVVVAFIVLIIGITWMAYAICIKQYKAEVDNGEYDRDIYQEFHDTNNGKGEIVGAILAYIALFILLACCLLGICCKINGKCFTVADKTVLVIETNSMSGFYNAADAQIYSDTLQFGAGDVCIFETTTNLTVGEVYAYSYNNTIITHRLIKYDSNTGLATFKGDNNETEDPYLIRTENILYHYTGKRIVGLGAFILYLQSTVGNFTVLGVIFIIISSELIAYRIHQINSERDKKMGGMG